VQLQNRCGTCIMDNSIYVQNNKKFNVLSKGYKKSLVSQVISRKLSSDYIFQLSKFSQTTP
jgi:hypothetical protein